MSNNKSSWGPALWKYLHISASYCEDAEGFCSLLRSIALTMPCPECRKHLGQYISKFTPEASIRGENPSEAATTYVFDLHNHVNALIGKPPLPRSTLRDDHQALGAAAAAPSARSQQHPPIPVHAAPPPQQHIPMATRRRVLVKTGILGNRSRAAATVSAAAPSTSSSVVNAALTNRAVRPTPARGLRYRQ